MNPEWEPLAFVGEEIEVSFRQSPQLEKKPPAPDAFRWRGQVFHVEECLLAWQDFSRRGKMAKNMRPANRRKAERRGSWGVGRFYYRVRVTAGRFFDIYFDRAPQEAGDCKGHWFLWREMRPADPD